MANTTAVYTRMDTNLKNSAEEILSQLGITPASAIQMFYSQIVLQRGLPFEAKLPPAKPVALGSLSRSELDAELEKGVTSIGKGRILSAPEVDQILSREFGV